MLLPNCLDLDQLLVRRGWLGPFPARPAGRLRFLDHLRLNLHLGAVGLDHHQARIVEKLAGVDARLFATRLLAARFFASWLFPPHLLLHRCGDRLHGHGGLRRVLAHFLGARVAFRARLELMDAPLLLDDRSADAALRRLLAPLAAAIALAPVTVAAVAPAAITTSAPMLFTLTFGSSAFAFWTITPWLLPLLGGLALLLRGPALWTRLRVFASERMELRRFA